MKRDVTYSYVRTRVRTRACARRQNERAVAQQLRRRRAHDHERCAMRHERRTGARARHHAFDRRRRGAATWRGLYGYISPGRPRPRPGLSPLRRPGREVETRTARHRAAGGFAHPCAHSHVYGTGTHGLLTRYKIITRTRPCASSGTLSSTRLAYNSTALHSITGAIAGRV